MFGLNKTYSNILTIMILWLLYILSALSIVYSIAAFWSSPKNIMMFLNFDFLTYVNLVHDLIYQHGHFMDWHLGAVLDLFPDISVLYLSSLFFKTQYTNILVYALFQIIFLLGIVALSLKAITRTSLGLRLGILSSLYFLLVLAIKHPFYIYSRFDYLNTILIPSFHFGSALLVITALFLFVKSWESNKNMWLILLFCLTILGGTSDLLYHVYFTFPMLATLTCLIYLGYIQNLPFFKFALVLSISCLISFLIYHYAPLPIDRYNLSISFNPAYILEFLKSIFNCFLKHNFFLGIPWLCFVVFAPYSLYNCWKNRTDISSSRLINQKDRIINFILLFELIMIMVGMIIILLTPHEIAKKAGSLFPIPMRYLIPLIINPCLIGFPILLYKHRHSLNWINGLSKNSYFCLLLLIMSTIALLIRPNFNSTQFFNYYPSFISWIDQNTKRYNLHNGLCVDIVTIKIINTYNRTGIHVADLLPDYSTPYNYLEPNQYFHYKNYDFIISINKKEKNLIVKRFGKPAHVATHTLFKRPKVTAYLYIYKNGELTHLAKKIAKITS